MANRWYLTGAGNETVATEVALAVKIMMGDKPSRDDIKEARRMLQHARSIIDGMIQETFAAMQETR